MKAIAAAFSLPPGPSRPSLPALPANAAVSIVLPVRNEAAHLAACLDSIRAQDSAAIAEILCAEGGSRDESRAILLRYAETDRRLRVIDNPAGVQTEGLNRAIRASCGEVVVRLDAHALYPPDYVRQCLAVLTETGAACVGGGLTALPAEGFRPCLYSSVLEHPFGTGVARFRRSAYEGPVETVWPGAYRREALAAVGLFRPALTRTEDLDLHARLRAAGYAIRQSPRIRPLYRPRTTAGEVARQYFANGEQVVETLRVNPAAIRLRHLAPLGWLTTLAALAGLAFVARGFFLAFLLLAGAYGLGCLLAASQIGARRGWSYAFPALFVFPWVHGAYGLGSWVGAAKLAAGLFRGRPAGLEIPRWR